MRVLGATVSGEKQSGGPYHFASIDDGEHYYEINQRVTAENKDECIAIVRASESRAMFATRLHLKRWGAEFYEVE